MLATRAIRNRLDVKPQLPVPVRGQSGFFVDYSLPSNNLLEFSLLLLLDCSADNGQATSIILIGSKRVLLKQTMPYPLSNPLAERD